jgi:hypothetical protein
VGGPPAAARRAVSAERDKFAAALFDTVQGRIQTAELGQAGSARLPRPGPLPADPYALPGRTGWLAAEPRLGPAGLQAVAPPGPGVRAAQHPDEPGAADADHHRHRLRQERVVPDPDPRPLQTGGGGVQIKVAVPLAGLSDRRLAFWSTVQDAAIGFVPRTAAERMAIACPACRRRSGGKS